MSMHSHYKLYHIILYIYRSGRQILSDEVGYLEGLNAASWDEDMVERFQRTVDNSNQIATCVGDVSFVGFMIKLSLLFLLPYSRVSLFSLHIVKFHM